MCIGTKLKKRIRLLLLLATAALFTVWIVCNLLVMISGHAGFVPVNAPGSGYEMIIVPGAGIRGNRPTPMLQDRLDTAAALYFAGAADRVLVSGDHASPAYNEVGVMKDYLLEAGVPATAILEDHFGTDTYTTMYHAARDFEISSAVVVTQRYHLYRAVYLGNAFSMDTRGIICDRYIPVKILWYELRETFSRCKAVWDCAAGRVPVSMAEPPE
ncbi:MAG: SanA/YdcF family protein [Christensenellales bacterium]|jgi:SanA protein